MRLIPAAVTALLVAFALTDIAGGETTEISVQTDPDIFTKVEKLVDFAKRTVKVVQNFNSVVSAVTSSISTVKSIVELIQGETSDTNELLKKQHDEVMQKLNQISTQINDVSGEVSDGFKGAIRDISGQIETIGNFLTLSNEISNFIESVNIQYQTSLGLIAFSNSTGQKLNKASLQNFESAVFDGNLGMAAMLEQIHSRIFRSVSGIVASNYLEAYQKYSDDPIRYANRCNKKISPNQQLYHIYLLLLANELKGLAVLCHGYEIRAMLRPGSYSGELDEVHNRFKSRVNSYKTAVQNVLPKVPTDIRRCNIPANSVGHVIQLKGYIRYTAESQEMVDDACLEKCEKLSQYFYRVESGSKFKTPITICPADEYEVEPLERKFEWIKDSTGKTFGVQKKCEKTTLKLDWKHLGNTVNSSWSSGPFALHHCDICGWTNVGEYPVVTGEHVTNINSNMVVTGIRFAQKHLGSKINALAIQIQEGKLLPGGKVTKNNDDSFMEMSGNSDWDKFDRTRRHIYLDDVILPESYVVTGIRLKETTAKDGFKIVVRGTKYDFDTGKLIPRDSIWYDPEDHPVRNSNWRVRSDRREIEIQNADNPIRGSFFDPEKNAYAKVKFTHTDVEKDAGQITLPLFDAQNLSGDPAVPLRGIGLFYKGSACCGGFVALRIFTESFEKYLK